MNLSLVFYLLIIPFASAFFTKKYDFCTENSIKKKCCYPESSFSYFIVYALFGGDYFNTLLLDHSINEYYHCDTFINDKKVFDNTNFCFNLSSGEEQCCYVSTSDWKITSLSFQLTDIERVSLAYHYSLIPHYKCYITTI